MDCLFYGYSRWFYCDNLLVAVSETGFMNLGFLLHCFGLMASFAQYNLEHLGIVCCSMSDILNQLIDSLYIFMYQIILNKERNMKYFFRNMHILFFKTGFQ